MPSRRGAGEKGLQSRGDPAKCLCWVGLGYTGCWRCWGLGAEPPGVRGWGGRQGLCTRQAGRMDEDVRGGEGSWARRQAQGQPVVEVVEAGIKPKNLIFSPEKKKPTPQGHSVRLLKSHPEVHMEQGQHRALQGTVTNPRHPCGSLRAAAPCSALVSAQPRVRPRGHRAPLRPPAFVALSARRSSPCLSPLS